MRTQPSRACKSPELKLGIDMFTQMSGYSGGYAKNISTSTSNSHNLQVFVELIVLCCLVKLIYTVNLFIMLLDICIPLCKIFEM